MQLNSYFTILIFLETVECSGNPWFKFCFYFFQVCDLKKKKKILDPSKP